MGTSTEGVCPSPGKERLVCIAFSAGRIISAAGSAAATCSFEHHEPGYEFALSTSVSESRQRHTRVPSWHQCHALEPRCALGGTWSRDPPLPAAGALLRGAGGGAESRPCLVESKS